MTNKRDLFLPLFFFGLAMRCCHGETFVLPERWCCHEDTADLRLQRCCLDDPS